MPGPAFVLPDRHHQLISIITTLLQVFQNKGLARRVVHVPMIERAHHEKTRHGTLIRAPESAKDNPDDGYKQGQDH